MAVKKPSLSSGSQWDALAPIARSYLAQFTGRGVYSKSLAEAKRALVRDLRITAATVSKVTNAQLPGFVAQRLLALPAARIAALPVTTRAAQSNSQPSPRRTAAPGQSAKSTTRSSTAGSQRKSKEDDPVQTAVKVLDMIRKVAKL